MSFVLIIIAIVIAGIVVYVVISSGQTSTTTPTTTLPPTDGYLRASFIDVGQGDSIYIKTPTGMDILIDGGEESAGSIVVDYLRNQGVDDIEIMIATHADSDHIGGLVAVLNAYVIEEVWVSGFTKETATYRSFDDAVKAEGCFVNYLQRGLAIDIDPFLDESVFNSPTTLYSESNQNFIVLKIIFKNISFLFTGDVDAQVESDILSQGFDVSSTVLKVAHHGSQHSSSYEFLSAVHPKVSTISVGAGNTYGHPAQVTLDTLATVGSEVYRTDLNGNIVLRTDGNTYTIFAQK